MTNGMSMAGLKLEQAPPLAVPASFFLTAPLAMLAGGVLLAIEGSPLLWTRFAGATAALAHLGTLGLLGSVMLGALYQMIPVVAGTPLPAVRAAHAVHAGLIASVASLAFGLATTTRVAVVAGGIGLACVLSVFLLQAGFALARAPARGATVVGMRVSVAGLALVVALGVAMSWVRGSGAPAPHYAGWVGVHLSSGVIVWIGGLICAVSFQVVPMFYLTPALPRTLQRVLVACFALTLVLLLLALAAGAETRVVALAAIPGALGAFLLHPLSTLWALAKRRRRRRDPSLDFWRVGLASALLVLPTGLAAVLADDTRFAVLFGWLALFGWAAMIVHGMLTRIVPFLVWFHRFSKRAGFESVPSMRELLPEALARTGFWVHFATLFLGVAALGTGSSVLARATGIGLGLTGALLFSAIVRVLAHGRRSATR